MRARWGESHRVERNSLPTLTEVVSDQLNLSLPAKSQAAEVEGLRQTL